MDSIGNFYTHAKAPQDVDVLAVLNPGQEPCPETSFSKNFFTILFFRNSWEYIAELPQAVCAHAGTGLHGQLYISGGFATDGFQRCVYCYSPETDTWEVKKSLNHERGLHCMVSFESKLFVIGGNNKTRIGCYDHEKYNTILLKYTIIHEKMIH